jgi:trehalose synthase
MWKGKPIIASAVGGIPDQVYHEEHGLLVDAPHDLAAFGTHVNTLLADLEYAAEIGRRGRARASEESLADRHLPQYSQMFEALS